jgi:hypothetical protein
MIKQGAPQLRTGANRVDAALPWLVWIAFLLLYSSTAAPSIVALFDDTLEFQLVLPTFGIAHPTGYPLYTLLGGIWSWLLPFGQLGVAHQPSERVRRRRDGRPALCLDAPLDAHRHRPRRRLGRGWPPRRRSGSAQFGGCKPPSPKSTRCTICWSLRFCGAR